MNAIFSQTKAKEICLQWISELNNSKLGADLKQKDCGRMLGILITTDNTVYKAFSGEILGQYTKESFVPPVFDVEQMKTILELADKQIKAEDEKTKKSQISRNCWKEIQNLYQFNCFDHKIRTLAQIYPSCRAGTGDCCAPRLLNQCFKDNKIPISMAEFYYGDGPAEHLKFYTPCDERCKPILKHIIGLDVIYLDDDIIVVNKPSGILAIEGKTQSDCIAGRVRNLYNTIAQPCIHRLDQATSGLMVLAITQKAHDILSKDFEERKIEKEYTAVVEGKIIDNQGIIDLPIRLDTDNRPHQIVDYLQGKKALTEWQKITIFKYKKRDCTKLLLKPQTGRTHQLRVHCAYGLKHPIVNDSLYGSNPENKALLLTATRLAFTHPITKKPMDFSISFEY